MSCKTFKTRNYLKKYPGTKHFWRQNNSCNIESKKTNSSFGKHYRRLLNLFFVGKGAYQQCISETRSTITVTWNTLVSKYLNANFDQFNGRLSYLLFGTSEGRFVANLCSMQLLYTIIDEFEGVNEEKTYVLNANPVLQLFMFQFQ